MIVIAIVIRSGALPFLESELIFLGLVFFVVFR